MTSDEPAWRRTTVSTLARAAGVAPSTVSRALRGDTRISPSMRRRIAAMAAEAGYAPNALARTLASGRSRLVGLALGPSDNPFYPELLQLAVRLAADRGLRLLMLHAGAGPVEDQTAEVLLGYQVDGCLFTAAELSSRVAQICRSRGVPVVMVNRMPRLSASAVSCHNEAGGADMAAYLIATGHRRLALVQGNPDSSTGAGRAEGFLRAAAAAGLPPVRILGGGTSYAGGAEAGRLLAASSTAARPDAVFAVADIAALGVIDALRDAGLEVPEAISVAGFDGIALGAERGLTTVVQPLAAMLGRGFEMLLARIADPSLPDETVHLRGELVVRRSVAPRPGFPA